MTRIVLEDDGKKGRFAIYKNDEFAGEMTFTWFIESAFIIDHTAIEEHYLGKGYGTLLVMEAVALAREKRYKILPLCPFAKKVFDSDKSLADVRN